MSRHRYALATACDQCAHLIGNPGPIDGVRMVPVHDQHVPELAAAGWILTDNDDGGPPDIACAHYHAANWHD